MNIAGMTELLVPLDGSDSSLRAVPVAVRLAGRLGLQVKLYTMVGDPGEEESARVYLERVLAENVPSGAELVVEVGDNPVAAIVAAAGEAAVPCMSTAGSVRFHQGHFGSVAEGVVRRLARPMFLVGPEMEQSPGSPTQKVVLPVDDSALSESAIEVAADLATAFDVPLWVVSVASPRQEAKSQVRGAALVVGHSRYVHNVAGRIRRAHPGLDVEYEALHDENPAEAIVRFVGDDGTAVMATHGRSGLSRLVAGSVATGVVARSKRAVVVFRPEAAE